MRLSVVVPALNEAAHLADTLRHLRDQAAEEVIVVDGGSSDGTVAVARAWARVVLARRGRASQMNAGAATASGEGLLFLHADTRLPADGLQTVRRVLAAGASGGRFRLRFDCCHPLLALYGWATRLPCFSYGDQGFFVHRRVFDALGGFSETVPFEDVDFWRRLQAHRPVIVPQEVVTSARRFNQQGVVLQQLINVVLLATAWTGADVRPLKRRLYQDVRSQVQPRA